MGAAFTASVRYTNSGNRCERGRYLVRRAEDYIDRNLGNDRLSLGGIAEHLAVTPSHFSSVFKKISGMSLVGYLTSRRMEKARSLLVSVPSARIADVAEMVGYADPYYFSKCFRKHFGLPPSLFQRGAQ
ncbi:MAG: AraC family transcriptional regulator [Rectinemataceae bacterium]